MVQATGTDSGSVTHADPLALTVFDFLVTATPPTQSVSAGQTAAYTLNLTPTGLSTFQQAVIYTCSGLPVLTNCAFTPTGINAGIGTTNVTLNISTTAKSAVNRHITLRRLFYALSLPAGLALFPTRLRKKPAHIAAITLLLILTSCGGGGLVGSGTTVGTGGSLGTPSGSYTVTITATEGSLVHSTSVTLIVR
jgi:hypothetical protein